MIAQDILDILPFIDLPLNYKNTMIELCKEKIMEDRVFNKGDIVQHFKRELLTEEEKNANMFVYQIEGVFIHSETGEEMMAYKALYPPFKGCVRPLNMFLSEVDHDKYPNIKQKYRFEKYDFYDFMKNN